MSSHDNAIFITGTDTGVGKTVVAGALAACLRERGVDVGVFKPAETGCRMKDGELVPADAVFLKWASGSSDPLEDVCPYRFAEPLAPAVAADRAGVKIRASLIKKRFAALRKRHEVVLVEGAGGLMVPLCGMYLFLDLAAELSLPVLVVGRAGLGAINHSLLSVQAARSRGLHISGIILNHGAAPRTGAAVETNPAVIKALSGVGGVMVMERVRGIKRSRDGLIRAGERLFGAGFLNLTTK